MSRITLLCAGALACNSNRGAPPEIWIDVSPVPVGVRSIEADALHFDLQLSNRGEQTLEIYGITVEGDQNCAFAFDGPDSTELGPDESAFVRGWYQPTVAAEDQVALVVESNADNLPTLVVPICGLGVTPETTEAETPECVVPSDDQPDCEE